MFTGQPDEFIQFINLFESVVATRCTDDVTRLNELFNHVSASVQRHLEPFLLDTQNGYQRALGVLWRLYGDATQIVDAVRRRLVDGRPALKANDYVGLMEYASAVGSAVDSVYYVQRAFGHVIPFNYPSLLDHPDTMHAVVSKLPSFMAKDFVRTLRGTPGTMQELRLFLEAQTSHGSHPLLRPRVGDKEARQKPKDQGQGKKAFQVTKGEEEKEQKADNYCLCCDRRHRLLDCTILSGKRPRVILDFLRHNKLCFNCFGNHYSNRCEQESKCKDERCRWNAKHHPKLHGKRKEDGEENEERAREVVSNFMAGSGVSSEERAKRKCKGTFLAVVPVTLTNPVSKKTISAFAMMDPCSNCDVLSGEAVELLGLDVRKANKSTRLSTVTGTRDARMDLAAVTVSSITDPDVTKTLDGVCVMPCTHFETNQVPTRADMEGWEDLGELHTAERVDVPRVLLLISMLHPAWHLPNSVVRNGPGFFAVQTSLGTVLHGTDPEAPVHAERGVHFVQSRGLDERLDQWLTDETRNLYDRKCTPSLEERKALDVMEKGMRFVDGRFEVPIPWRNDPLVMPDNLNIASKCMERKKEKFKRDPELFAEYSNAIRKYEREGFAKRVPEDELQVPRGKRFFLPITTFYPGGGGKKSKNVSDTSAVPSGQVTPDAATPDFSRVKKRKRGAFVANSKRQLLKRGSETNGSGSSSTVSGSPVKQRIMSGLGPRVANNLLEFSRKSPRGHASTKSLLSAEPGMADVHDECSNDSLVSVVSVDSAKHVESTREFHKLALTLDSFLKEEDPTLLTDTDSSDMPPMDIKHRKKRSRRNSERSRHFAECDPMDRMVASNVDSVLLECLEDEVPSVTFDEEVPGAEPLELVENFHKCNSMQQAGRWVRKQRKKEPPTPSSEVVKAPAVPPKDVDSSSEYATSEAGESVTSVESNQSRKKKKRNLTGFPKPKKRKTQSLLNNVLTNNVKKKKYKLKVPPQYSRQRTRPVLARQAAQADASETDESEGAR